MGSNGAPFVATENIYKVSRRIKRTEQTLYNALRSIYEDALFVREIRGLWPELPLLANLRCGLWYAPEFDGTCYFKSTDGHNGNWSFSPIRLNLHVAKLAAERGGCCIVDATRKGKRFPDSMSKTIPIWTCVLNRAIADFRPPRTQDFQLPVHEANLADSTHPKDPEASKAIAEDIEKGADWNDWDCSLHLPLWVSDVERANISTRIDAWVSALKSTGADLHFLAKVLKKPLRPLWISQKTVIWLNEVPDLDEWSFTPIILVSASRPSVLTQRFSDSEFSWMYIPGAADDEESWARGLSPTLFWKNSLDIISGGPSACNKIVSEIVEQDRVHRAIRGHDAPQEKVKRGAQYSGEGPDDVVRISFPNNNVDHVMHGVPTSSESSGGVRDEARWEERSAIRGENGVLEGSISENGCEIGNKKNSAILKSDPRETCPGGMKGFHWIGNTGLAVGKAECGSIENIYGLVDCVINCGAATMTSSGRPKSFLYLPIVGPKSDRFSLQEHLGKAVSFAGEKLARELKVFICCSNGEDISICVCLAVLLAFFDSEGRLEKSLPFNTAELQKSDVRNRLIYLASFSTDARPSRGSLRQVYNFFMHMELRKPS